MSSLFHEANLHFLDSCPSTTFHPLLLLSPEHVCHQHPQVIGLGHQYPAQTLPPSEAEVVRVLRRPDRIWISSFPSTSRPLADSARIEWQGLSSKFSDVSGR